MKLPTNKTLCRDTCPKAVQACCDVKTCSLLAGAECATGPCCDIQSAFGDPSRTTCKLKQSGSVCREAGNSCDLPEYCSGESEWCPADVFKTDGETCYTQEGYKVRSKYNYLLYRGSRNATLAVFIGTQTKSLMA